MILMLLVLALLSVLELLLFIPQIWPHRRLTASFLLVLMAMVTGALTVKLPGLVAVPVLIIGLYRLFNLVRIASRKVETHRLRRTAWITSLWLLVAQVTSLAAFGGVQHLLNGVTWDFWAGVAGVQLLVAAILWVSTNRQLVKTTALAATDTYSDKQLPSITVCVPARNETESLAACLESLIASNYPKFEIIVLDDCSQDKTAEVIKSFAHDGVRFIHGSPPPETWLAKNWAYQQLYEAANGELLVFCGVDIRMEPQSLRAMVTTALGRKKTMLCLVPQNITPPDLRPSHSTLLQPMRYAWELSFPRRRFNRPPALSSCWLVARTLLADNGTFEAVTRSVDPERAIAALAIKNDGYSFLQSNAEMVVTSQKTIADQLNTAVRTRYPQVRRRPELVGLVGVVQLVCLVAPLPLCVVALWQSQWIVAVLSGLAFAISSGAYARIVRLTYRRFLWRSLLALPFAALFDAVMRHYSMWQYEFAEVYWKGRNICLPVMHVEPHLPKLT
jgi:hypothetical protein